MPNGEYKLHDVERDMQRLEKNQQTIIECLRGDDTKHDATGLIDASNKNTEFRQKCQEEKLLDKVKGNTDWCSTSKKWIAIILVAIITAIINHFVGVL